MTRGRTGPEVLSAEVGAWPDPEASVAVVDADGVLASHGDLQEERAWASVTKLLSALTVLVLAHEGAVDLDEPVPAAPRAVALRDLLDHTSGLAFEAPTVRAAAGTRRIYSNAGVEVAAAHVATRTGTPFAELLTTRVTGPLGLGGIRLPGSPAHGLRAPTTDLARLAGELLAPRRLPVAVVDALRTPSRPGLPGLLPGFGRQVHNDWGLGAEVRADKDPHWTSPLNDPATFGHFGQSGTALWVDRSAGLALVTAARTPFGPWAADAWPRLSTAVLREWDGS